ncbi:general secretion pathway protein L [Roseateles sp. YR242]|uniref:type II secretion system protein GspL n=1 Tax=Roseateles sp. YR242 TaxID=1855305 RepID=UPI0008C05666|nr:type II secretion system protein GspL [Roseateles sp. YR242]SEL74407.1 general secretion pathway protein L [Roseateles sp. YR242]
MSTLLILLPTPLSPAAGTQDYEFWFSPDAQAPARTGGRGERASLSAMPKADRVIALIGDAAISWHTVRLPLALKGPKLRSALSGVLEEQLLDDPERLHLAIMDVDAPAKQALAAARAARAARLDAPPTEIPGHQDTQLDDGEHPSRWVAAIARDPLRSHLEAFQAAGLLLESLLPLSWPGELLGGHVDQGSDGQPRLRAWTPSGIASFPMHSTGVRTWLGESWWEQAKLTASPVVSAEAERWLGRPVEVVNDTERAWAARLAPINLLQFDLTPRQRGWQRVYRAWHVMQTPDWRPFRWGVIGLVVVQIIGLNVMAFQQRRAVNARHVEQETLLRQSFPQVRTIRDAPAQMQRETETARARAGQVGPGDLEDLLAAVARAMPPGQPPLQGLRYESNRLLLTGLPGPIRDQMRDRLGQNPNLRVSDEGDALQLSLRPTTR